MFLAQTQLLSVTTTDLHIRSYSGTNGLLFDYNEEGAIDLFIYTNLYAYKLYTNIIFTGSHWMFEIIEENASVQGIAYDYQSIMHFRNQAFSRNNLNTIVLLKHRFQRSSNTRYPSTLDIRHLNVLYCGGTHFYI